MLALGAFSRDVDPGRFSPPMPYEPADQLLSPDGYWAAKRIAALSPAHLALAIDAGKITDARTRRVMQAILEARQANVVTYWYGRVTPIEFVSLERTKLLLRDEAVTRRVVPRDITDYRFDFFTSTGSAAAETMRLHPKDDKLELVLPDGAMLAARDYLVVQVTARRGKRTLPRAFEVHVKLEGDRSTVVGLRH
jgi:hypothetical protein